MIYRHRKLLGWMVGIFLCLGAGLVWYLTSSPFLQPRIQRALSDATRADCTVRGVRVWPLGNARLGEVRVQLMEGDTKAAFLVLRDVRIDLGWWRLITGGDPVRNVRVGNMWLRLRPEVVRWAEDLAGAGKSAGAPALPPIEVANGRVRADFPGGFPSLEAERLRASLRPPRAGGIRGAGSASVEGHAVAFRLESTPSTGATTLSLEINEMALESLPLPRDHLPAFLDDIDLSGRASGAVCLSFTESGGGPRVEGEVSLAQVSATAPGWPAPISDLSGNVSLHARGLTTRHIEGRLGEAGFRIGDARVGFRPGEDVDYGVEGEVRGLDLALMRRGDLARHARPVLAELGLSSGTADVEFALQRSAGGEPEVQASVLLSAPEASPSAFPLPLRDLRAGFRVRSLESIRITQARSRLFDGDVEVEGMLTRSAGGEWIPDLQLRLTDVHLSGDQVDQVPREVRPILEGVGLKQGRMGGRISVRADKVVMDGRIDDASFMAPEFPYPVEKTSSEFRWSSDAQQVEVRNLVARHAGGIFNGRGTVDMREGMSFDCVLDGEGVPVDRHLRNILEPKMRQRWDAADPHGSVDLNLRLRDWQPKGSVPAGAIEGSARLRGVSLTHQATGMTARDLHGSVRLAGPTLYLSQVSGDVLGLSVTADGRLPLRAGNGPLRINLQSARVRLRPALLQRWPKVIATPVQELSPSGDIELHAEIRSTGEEEGSAVADGLVLLHGVALQVGDWPVEATGEMAVNVREMFGDNRQADVRLHLQRATAGPLRASDLVGFATLSAHDLTIERSDAKLYGGALVVEEGALDLKSLEWSMEASLSHLDLESLLGAFGMEGRGTPDGSVRGNVELTGRGWKKSRLSGGGEIKVDRGHLYDLPIVLTVLKLFDLSLPRESPVTNAYAGFRVGEGSIRMEDALLSGGTVPVHVRGTIGLEEDVALAEQPVDLVFTVPRKRGLLDAIPVINWIKHLTIDKLRRLVLQARVRGTVSDYRATTPFSPVTAPIGGMWRLLQKLSPEQTEEFLPPVRER